MRASALILFFACVCVCVCACAVNCEEIVGFRNCTAQEFQCDNRKCVGVSSLCDGYGIDDCGDESDEKYCKTADCGHPDLFKCKSTGKCLPKHKICNDDYSDCGKGDISDEIDCWNPDADTNGRGCPVHTFACIWDGSRRCKNEWNRCDGFRDCEDALDELNCPPRFANGTKYCEAGQFECKNHLCLRMDQICDGKDDCLDGHDELAETCDAKLHVQKALQKHLVPN